MDQKMDQKSSYSISTSNLYSTAGVFCVLWGIANIATEKICPLNHQTNEEKAEKAQSEMRLCIFGMMASVIALVIHK